MEFALSSLRIGALISLLALFGLLGGFGFPEDSFRYLTRAWMGSVLLFVLGAVSATIVDHWVGNLDRSNLRWLYIVLGVLGMGGGLMYQHVLRSRMEIEDTAALISTGFPIG